MVAVSNVVDALAAVCQLDAHPELPTWIPSFHGQGVECPPNEILAVGNGLLHVPTRHLYPSTPGFFSLNASEVMFDTEPSPPYQWHKFLNEVFGTDQEAKDALQEWLGYQLVPDTSLQKILLIVGPKRGGKGTIGRIIRALLGHSSVAAMTLANLGQQFGLQHLIGKIGCVIPDARFSAKADPAVVAERLLSISGEDALPIDRKFKGMWEGPLKIRFTIMTNELPNLADCSGALVERFVVLKLKHSFAGREDPTLFERLCVELPAILNWAIAGYKRLKEHGRFEMPASSADTIRAMKEIGSPISNFVAECCELGPDCEISKKELFSKWKAWCLQTQNKSGTESLFGRDLRAAISGIEDKRPRGENRQRVYTGITLLERGEGVGNVVPFMASPRAGPAQ
jgi:putative DNA primase/helicase